jgi:hypothetical protein
VSMATPSIHLHNISYGIDMMYAFIDTNIF